MSPITRRWQRDLDQKDAETMPTQIERGSRVRRIDEPYVLLRVREVDPDGSLSNSGTPTALCFNSFGHGKWMPLNELELAIEAAERAS